MERCKRIEPYFIYIIGLCGLLAGTVSTFLLDAPLTHDTFNTDACTEWGEWRVLSEHPICFLIHERNSTSDICNKTEYKYCKDVAKWSEWGPLDCTVRPDTCSIERTRNCSVKDLKDCYSNETSKDLTIWGDINTCPCTKGQTVHNETGNGHWQAWSEWRCQINSDHCYIYRARQCSVPNTENCPPKDSSQLKLWTDKCPCEKDSVLASTNQTATISTSTAVWKAWGEWKCHDVDFGCIMSKNRQCSSEESVCKGQHYELDVCKEATCKELDTSNKETTTTIPSTKLMWTDWGDWECHNDQHPCVLYRRRSCSNGRDASCHKTLGGRQYDIKQCDDACKVSHKPPSTTNATSTMATLMSEQKTTPTVSNSSTTIGPTATEFVPTYWLEWSSWECTFPIPGVCLMGHTRNCSISDVNHCITELGGVGYKVEPCRSDICPATWLEWGKWRCRMGDHGICNMTRTRGCSTKSTEDCGTEYMMIKPCDPNLCPELVKLQQSGQCKDYVSGKETCTDASTCDTITNKDHPVCSYHNTASIACPKACGCCEEQPHWLEWSSWKCNLAPNRTCEMKRTRKCSTDSLDDCVGQNALEASCSNLVCPDIIHASANVDCSGFDAQTTECKDGAGCSEFKSVFGLSLVCKEEKEAAECPVSCGCCEVVPLTTVVQATPTSSSSKYTSTTNDMSTINTVSSNSTNGNNTSTKTTISVGGNKTSSSPTVRPSPTGVDNGSGTSTLGGHTMSGASTSKASSPSSNPNTVAGSSKSTNTVAESSTSTNPTRSSIQPVVNGSSTSMTSSTYVSKITIGSTSPSTYYTTVHTGVDSSSTTVPTFTSSHASTIGVSSMSTNPTTTHSPGVYTNRTSMPNTTFSSFKTVDSSKYTTIPSSTKADSSSTFMSSTTFHSTAVANSNNASTINPTSPSTLSTSTTSTTTTPKPAKTTHKPYTLPPQAVTCKVCAGPEFLCEKLYMDKQCEPPNNYCINKLSNHKDGTRMVTRSCGDFDTCYRDWFLGSSDSDKCRKFDDNNIITLDFDCTYCCINNDCNEPIRPSDATLYKDL